MKKYSIVILNHYNRLSPRVEQEINTFRKQGWKVLIIKWHRLDNKSQYPQNQFPQNNNDEVTVITRDPKTLLGLYLYLPWIYLLFSLKLMRVSFQAIHCAHLILLPISIFWGKIKRVPVIYDAYEFHLHEWKDRLPSLLHFVISLITIFEDYLIKSVDGILTIDSAEGFLEKKYMRLNKKVEVVYNVPLKNSAHLNNQIIEKLSKKYNNRKIIIYVGGLSVQKGALVALDAAKEVINKHRDVLFLFIGMFHRNTEKLFWNRVNENKVDEYVEFIDWLPYDEMLHYVAISKVGLILHQPIKKFFLLGKGNGRKAFTYMQFRIPVVAPNFGNIGSIIKEEQCGLLVDTTKPSAISDAISYLLSNPEEAKNMGERGRKAIEKIYNWEIEEQKIIKLYKSVGVVYE